MKGFDNLVGERMSSSGQSSNLQEEIRKVAAILSANLFFFEPTHHDVLDQRIYIADQALMYGTRETIRCRLPRGGRSLSSWILKAWTLFLAG